MVSIPACHAGDPGSIPGLGVFFPCVFHHKKDPGNRSRTSDLEISVVAIYSLPLCQLSYTRIERSKPKEDAVCGDRTHALTNTRLKRAP